MKPRRQNVGDLTISRRITRSMTKLQPNSFQIPNELVFEIFSRLPSKSIARCCCVSKLWSSLLRSQDFTELFLTRSCARPQILFAFQVHDEPVFISSPQPKNPEENSYVVATNHLARLPIPYYYNNYGCSTNGFFCYEANRICKEQKKPVPGCVPVICNPNTGQSLTLPPRQKSKKRYGVKTYLGYDPISKEFKLLSMSSRVGEMISVEHQVLTLGTNNLSWRLLECCTPHFFSDNWICISGVLFYPASVDSLSRYSMVVCFDLRSEKFSSVKLMDTFNRSMQVSTILVNYCGKLGLIMSRDSCNVTRESTSFEMWVLQDAAKHVWSKHVYVLPPSWEDVVSENMYIAGLVGTNEIVFSPFVLRGPAYVIYYNVERKTITKVRIQGMEAYQGERFRTFLNYVENVEIL